MGKYTQQLSRVKVDFQRRYDEIKPDVFGDETLLKLQDEIEELAHQLETHRECEECNGWGTTECYECGHDRDCQECDDGLIEL